MNYRRPIILILLAAYIFGPTFFDWITDPSSGWYKPYAVWAAVIVGTIVLQLRNKPDDT